MRNQVTLLWIVLFFCRIALSYAADWKKLHEQADALQASAGVEHAAVRPDSVEGAYVLGLLYLNVHKDAEAAGAFTKVLALDPGALEAKWGLAEVLRRQHQPEKSEELIAEVLTVHPTFPPALITLAYLKYIRMDFEGAAALAKKVLALGDNDVDTSNRVRAYLLYGGTKGMIAHYGGPLSKIINGTAVLPSLKAAERLQPDSAGVHFGLGSFYLLAPRLAGGDLEKAEAHLKRAIEIDPLFTDAYVRLGQFYKMKGDEARYDEFLHKALSIDPQNDLAVDIYHKKCRFICPDQNR